jgi:hypothetical protein
MHQSIHGWPPPYTLLVPPMQAKAPVSLISSRFVPEHRSTGSRNLCVALTYAAISYTRQHSMREPACAGEASSCAKPDAARSRATEGTYHHRRTHDTKFVVNCQHALGSSHAAAASVRGSVRCWRRCNLRRTSAQVSAITPVYSRPSVPYQQVCSVVARVWCLQAHCPYSLDH